jgi:hypothetical protein
VNQVENPCGLHIGFVDFAVPTLLLLGEPSSFNWLADQIAKRQTIELKGALSEGALSEQIASLILLPVKQEGGLSRMGSTLEWRMIESEANAIIQQLRGLAVSELPAHAYLDPINNMSRLQVMASHGEYNYKLIFRDALQANMARSKR